MQDLLLKRFKSDRKSTVGSLYVNGLKACYILEDAYNKKKIKGRTRIPAGRYKLGLRKTGGFHSRYEKRFPFHIGMIQLLDVPNYTFILFHCGNDHEDTDGCLLSGTTFKKTSRNGFTVQASAVAYEKVYPEIAQYLDEGNELWIDIIDNDK